MSNTSLVNPNYKALVYISFAATGAATGALFTRWETTKIIGLTVLTGAAYGIANDMLACRECIEYFTIGHNYHERKLEFRPIQSLNPNLNAIAWGMIATWHVCTIAGIALAIASRAPFPYLHKKISASKIAPALAIGASLTFIFAHFNSRAAKKIMEENISNSFKYEVPREFQVQWEACNSRNASGYLGIAFVGTLIAIGIVAARSGIVEKTINLFRN